MASSSSAIDPYNNYDVFLSFRGGDTRNNFTSHIYKALCLNNINAFIDNKIDRGDEITPALERVIEAVKLSIIVFSSDYVSSTFCLDELVKIIECKESKSQIVLPIFYKVEPSKITYQEGFAKHETMEPEMKAKRWYTFFCDALFLPSKQSHKKHEEETIKRGMKVEKWRLAFHKALELAGWHIDDNSVEAEIIEKITEEVRKKLDSCLPKGEELMCTSMVGQTAEDNFKKIWECLMDNHISRVGLYGMGGVGKTTIATRINDQLLATINSFSLVCWVTVSKDLSIYNMQNKIAEMIKLDFSNEDDEWKRAAKLRKRLKNEKFVLILDDVWVAFEIEDVGIPPLVDGKKLFMTSRSRRVCERMECLPIEMKPLSEQEALNLFIKESKYQINGSLEWGNIVNSIVKECAGLPLAIVVVARRMKGAVKIWEWRNTLQELQKPVEGENLEMEKKVFKILKFSYDCLSNDKYQHCFLYCSLFPEDHLFERKDLIDYWIGEGLIDETYSKQAQFDKGNVILDELIDASLLEIDDHWERIKMHDVIRDMAHINVKVGLHSKDSFESVQVLKMLKSFPNSTLHCSKLKTLLLQGFYMGNLPVCFFANMQRLVVLHISRVKSIPNSITNLGNLRVLTINECDSLECIPSLARLEKLWHLNISWNRRLKEIPKDIELLVNLRVLDLSDNWSLDGLFPSGVVEKLSHLQTLNLKGTMVEVEAEALIRLEKLEVLKVHFYNLQKLNCYIQSGHWQRLLKYHINYGEQIVENWEKEMYSKIMSFKAIRDAEE